MDHADRLDLDILGDDVAIERREQRRGGRAIEAGIVEEVL
jgi:hypothetical protein